MRQDRIGVQHVHREAAGEELRLTGTDRVDGRLRLDAVGGGIAVAGLYGQVGFAG